MKSMVLIPVALAFTASVAFAQNGDDRVQRILDRIDREIRESHERFRSEVRAIIQAEIQKQPPTPVQKRATLGITAGDLTDAERQALGAGNGVKIDKVRGPAAEAGMQPGDILVELDGLPATEERLGEILERHKPGNTVEAVVLRRKKREPLKITLGEAKD